MTLTSARRQLKRNDTKPCTNRVMTCEGLPALHDEGPVLSARRATQLEQEHIAQHPRDEAHQEHGHIEDEAEDEVEDEAEEDAGADDAQEEHHDQEPVRESSTPCWERWTCRSGSAPGSPRSHCSGMRTATIPRKNSTSLPTLDERRTLTVAEVAALLGISRSTAYECVRRGEIPSRRFGRRVVVLRHELEQLLGEL